MKRRSFQTFSNIPAKHIDSKNQDVQVKCYDIQVTPIKGDLNIQHEVETKVSNVTEGGYKFKLTKLMIGSIQAFHNENKSS